MGRQQQFMGNMPPNQRNLYGQMSQMGYPNRMGPGGMSPLGGINQSSTGLSPTAVSKTPGESSSQDKGGSDASSTTEERNNRDTASSESSSLPTIDEEQPNKEEN